MQVKPTFPQKPVAQPAQPTQPTQPTQPPAGPGWPEGLVVLKDEAEIEAAMQAASNWPIPEHGPWCRLYAADVLHRPGFFDPPDLGPARRTQRIRDEFPEILLWADRIAMTWRREPFMDLGLPVRQRIIAAMMYASVRGEIEGRAQYVAPYLLFLRGNARDQALQALRCIQEIVGVIVGAAQVVNPTKADLVFGLELAGRGFAIGAKLTELGVNIGARGLDEATIKQLVDGAANLAATAGQPPTDKPTHDELLEHLDAVAGVVADLLGE